MRAWLRRRAAGSRSRRRDLRGAAVAAAVIVPMIWERGTLVATAMTPVIVALVSSGLRKSADRLTAATKTVRRSATGAAVRDSDFDPLRRRTSATWRCATTIRSDLRGRAAGSSTTGSSRWPPARRRSRSPSSRSPCPSFCSVAPPPKRAARRSSPAASEETPTPTPTPTPPGRRRPPRRRDADPTATPSATPTATSAPLEADTHADGHPLMAKDRIPTSRVARTARVRPGGGPGGATSARGREPGTVRGAAGRPR